MLRVAAFAALEPVAHRQGNRARATVVGDAWAGATPYAQRTPSRDGRPVWRAFLSFEVNASAAPGRRKPNVRSRRPRLHAIDPLQSTALPDSLLESSRSVSSRGSEGSRRPQNRKMSASLKGRSHRTSSWASPEAGQCDSTRLRPAESASAASLASEGKRASKGRGCPAHRSHRPIRSRCGSPLHWRSLRCASKRP